MSWRLLAFSIITLVLMGAVLLGMIMWRIVDPFIEGYLVLPSFLAVFLKVTQQLNVVKDKKLFVPFVSYGMAIAEVFIIGGVVAAGATWAAVNGVALGGATGAIVGMTIHNRFFG